MHTSLIIAIPTTETFHRSGDNLQWVAAPKLPRLVGMAEGRQTIKCEYLQVYSTDGWHVIHHAHTHTHTQSKLSGFIMAVTYMDWNACGDIIQIMCIVANLLSACHAALEQP